VDRKAAGQNDVKVVVLARGRTDQWLDIYRPSPTGLKDSSTDLEGPYANDDTCTVLKLTGIVGLLESLAHDSRRAAKVMHNRTLPHSLMELPARLLTYRAPGPQAARVPSDDAALTRRWFHRYLPCRAPAAADHSCEWS
jgi:hypothetical protein